MFSKQSFALLICLFLLLDWNVVLAEKSCQKEWGYTFRINPSRCATTVGVVVGVPAIIAALGFGAGGIGAGTFASWLMSWWGGSVPAGGIVAILQSLGAKGLASFASTYVGQALLACGCLEKIEVCS